MLLSEKNGKKKSLLIVSYGGISKEDKKERIPSNKQGRHYTTGKDENVMIEKNLDNLTSL